jgi:hypothetical protein
MKKVIELLERAKAKVTLAWGDEPKDDYLLNSAVKFIDQAIDELKPRWETPEQWEKRTGEKWPDNGAVYFKSGRLYPHPLATNWGPCRYKTAKRDHNICVVATEAGPPPAKWEPEEAGK